MTTPIPDEHLIELHKKVLEELNKTRDDGRVVIDPKPPPPLVDLKPPPPPPKPFDDGHVTILERGKLSTPLPPARPPKLDEERLVVDPKPRLPIDEGHVTILEGGKVAVDPVWPRLKFRLPIDEGHVTILEGGEVAVDPVWPRLKPPPKPFDEERAVIDRWPILRPPESLVSDIAKPVSPPPPPPPIDEELPRRVPERIRRKRVQPLPA